MQKQTAQRKKAPASAFLTTETRRRPRKATGRSQDIARERGLDDKRIVANNPRVLFNNGTGFSRLNRMADSRHHAAFFTSTHHATRAPSMAGRGGEPSGCRFHSAGLLTPPRARHPRLAAGASLTLRMEATMPSIALRAFRAVFPLHAYRVSTVATLPEARALAALLVASGKRAVIQPAAAGFAVAEVCA